MENTKRAAGDEIIHSSLPIKRRLQNCSRILLSRGKYSIHIPKKIAEAAGLEVGTVYKWSNEEGYIKLIKQEVIKDDDQTKN